jgi:hypothetical protein
MITKEQFVKLITDNRKHNDRLDEVEDVLGLAIYDCDWVEYGNILFDEVLGLLFQEEGVDDINWWLYEKCGRPDYKMWDKDGNEIPTETLDDLWEIVKDYRK